MSKHDALCSSWPEEQRTKWLLEELTGKRPLLPPGLACTPEVAEVLSTFRILAELPPDSLGAYVISMAHTASDVLAVVLLQVTPRPLVGPMHIYFYHSWHSARNRPYWLQGKRCSSSMLHGDAFVSSVLSLAMRGCSWIASFKAGV